jgi:hypothetical protein
VSRRGRGVWATVGGDLFSLSWRLSLGCGPTLLLILAGLYFILKNC